MNYASVIPDNDALSQDIVYHKQCITEQWQLLERKLECGGDDLPSSNTFTGGNADDSVLNFSIDNIDAQVDASDGRNSFHATAMAVYQREPSVEDAIDVENKSARSLKDVPTTIVPLIQSTITGNPKPPTSPYFPHFKTGRNEDQLRRSELGDLAWLLVRHFHRDGGNAVNILSPQCEDSQERKQKPILCCILHKKLFNCAKCRSPHTHRMVSFLPSQTW